jgi:hypothetical protein
LLLSQPSQPITGNYRTSNSFVFSIGSIYNDLIIDTTVLEGNVAVSVDPFSQPICTIGRAPQRVIQCSGLWTDINANNGNPPLRIFASSPCATANQSLSCDPTSVYRLGDYFVTTIVFWSPSTFIVTATQPGLIVSLNDGEVLSGATSFDTPAIYSFALLTNTVGYRSKTTQFTITASDRRLIVYVSACLQSKCNDTNLSPSPITPTGIILYTGIINARSVSSFIVNGSSLCLSNIEPCIFILSLYCQLKYLLDSSEEESYIICLILNLYYLLYINRVISCR